MASNKCFRLCSVLFFFFDFGFSRHRYARPAKCARTHIHPRHGDKHVRIPPPPHPHTHTQTHAAPLYDSRLASSPLRIMAVTVGIAGGGCRATAAAATKRVCRSAPAVFNLPSRRRHHYPPDLKASSACTQRQPRLRSSFDFYPSLDHFHSSTTTSSLLRALPPLAARIPAHPFAAVSGTQFLSSRRILRSRPYLTRTKFSATTRDESPPPSTPSDSPSPPTTHERRSTHTRTDAPTPTSREETAAGAVMCACERARERACVCACVGVYVRARA